MRILILTNYQLGLYKFRRELLERMARKGYKVYVSVPEGDFTEEIKKTGVKVIRNEYMDRRGTNPVHDIRLINYYKALLKKCKPDIVLTYTIKPNAYGGYLCGRYKIPYVVNVTGLGTAIQNGGLMQKLTLFLYKRGLRKAQRVFFQNENDRQIMIDHGIVEKGITDVLPGSGVNTEEHSYEPYPDEGKGVIFTTVGRIMKDKGIDEILSAAEIIKKRYPKTSFRLIGDFDEDYKNQVRAMAEKGIIEYLGFQKDVHSFMAESHAIIQASYHEGMSNVLLEASACGRPVLASNVPGCREIFEEGVTGLGFEARNAESLERALEKFLLLPNETRKQMGIAARRKMEQEFDRNIIIDAYLEEIDRVRVEGSKV